MSDLPRHQLPFPAPLGGYRVDLVWNAPEGVDKAIVTWLVDTGYGSDYTLKEPIPKNYRWPLAEEYSRRTIQDGKGYVPEESPEHWYALLALALGWEASDE